MGKNVTQYFAGKQISALGDTISASVKQFAEIGSADLHI
jgi:hypothetical protein